MRDFECIVEGRGLKYKRYSGQKTFKAEVDVTDSRVTITGLEVPGLSRCLQSHLPLSLDVNNGECITTVDLGDISGTLFLAIEDGYVTGCVKLFPQFHLCPTHGSMRMDFKECRQR